MSSLNTRSSAGTYDQIEVLFQLDRVSGSTRSRRRRWRRRRGERKLLTMDMDIPTIPRVAVDPDIWFPDGRELLSYVCSRRFTSLLQEVEASSETILTICKTELNLIPIKSSVFNSSISSNWTQLPDCVKYTFLIRNY